MRIDTLRSDPTEHYGPVTYEPNDYALSAGGTVVVARVQGGDRYYGPGTAATSYRVIDVHARTTLGHHMADGLEARIVVDDAGRFAAVLDRSGYAQKPRVIEVRRFRDGVSDVLDSGAKIVENSLALRGETVAWTNGAGLRSAALDG